MPRGLRALALGLQLRDGSGIGRRLVGIERLMREMGLQGVIRGKPIRTAVGDKAAPCPLDTVNRQFHAQALNRLWLSDFTCFQTYSLFVSFEILCYEAVDPSG